MTYQTLTDSELLAALKSDQEPAFDEIYRRYWKPLVDEAFIRLKNFVECEEVVQEVFIYLWNKRDSLDIQHLSAYLRTAVKNQVFLLYKREKRLPSFEEPLENMAAAGEEADTLFRAKELKASIKAWMEMQPERRRQIFHLRYIEDYTPKEISEMLSISQSTVHNTLSIAVSNLKSSLGHLAVLLAVSGRLH